MTVGYGDRYPVAVTGRFVAAGLMIGGITLLGVVTASIATWFIARVREAETTAEERVTRRIEDLHTEIDDLKKMITDLSAARSQPIPDTVD